MLTSGTHLTRQAIKLGASAAGVCSVSALTRDVASLQAILPGARSVVCLAFAHSPTALSSADPYVKQYDTIFCYDEVARVCHQLVRYLESEGHPAIAIPAFLPLDMSDGKLGMTGAIDWRTAAVESGLGVLGKSGLLVTPQHGPRVRLGGVITTADLRPDSKQDFSPCAKCDICLQSCPATALSGEGRIDKEAVR